MKFNTFTLIKSGFACITSDNPQYSYHLSHFIFLTCFYLISILHNGVLPVKRTIKNNKFLYRQPCYGWRYFMLLLCIAYDIPLVSLHVVFFEVVHCCNNLCN